MVPGRNHSIILFIMSACICIWSLAAGFCFPDAMRAFCRSTDSLAFMWMATTIMTTRGAASMMILVLVKSPGKA